MNIYTSKIIILEVARWVAPFFLEHKIHVQGYKPLLANLLAFFSGNGKYSMAHLSAPPTAKNQLGVNQLEGWGLIYQGNK